MDDSTAELTDRFERYCSTTSDNEIPPEILGELQSMLRLYHISPEELDFKWQAYSLKMGEENKLSLKTARDFKKNLQDALERESRTKTATRTAPTPRAKGGDVFDMYAIRGIVCRSSVDKNQTRWIGAEYASQWRWWEQHQAQVQL